MAEPLPQGETPTFIDAARFTPANRRRVSGPGLRGFLNIAKEWSLTEGERLAILGFPGRSTYHAWVQRARGGEALTLPVDTLLRISALLGIYKALKILFLSEGEAQRWLNSPNAGPLFGGQRPRDLLTCGTQDGLLQLRRFLDAWRGGIFAPPTRADSESRPLTADDLRIL